MQRGRVSVKASQVHPPWFPFTNSLTRKTKKEFKPSPPSRSPFLPFSLWTRNSGQAKPNQPARCVDERNPQYHNLPFRPLSVRSSVVLPLHSRSSSSGSSVSSLRLQFSLKPEPSGLSETLLQSLHSLEPRRRLPLSHAPSIRLPHVVLGDTLGPSCQ